MRSIVYNDKQSLFSELLEKDGSISIHMRNIQSVAIEKFRVSRNLSSSIMNDIFKQKDKSRYNLRQISEFSRPFLKSVYHGSKSVAFLGPKTWDMLPDDYKDIDNSNTFKNKIKNWKPGNCPCRICKDYINNIGFVWERKGNLEYSVALFLLLAKFVLLQVHASFFNLFNLLCLACLWVHWDSWFLHPCRSYRKQSVNF